MSAPNTSSQAEKWLIRVAIVQTFMAIAAVLISVAALWAAFVQANSAQRQLDASVWPYVAVFYTIDTTGETPVGMVIMENTGVGPARIRSVRVTVDEQPVESWFAALETVGAPTRFSYINMSGQVLGADQQLNVLRLSDPNEPYLFRRDHWSDIHIEYCYCSVFDQCSIGTNRLQSEPQEVNVCPAWDGERFAN